MLLNILQRALASPYFTLCCLNKELSSQNVSGAAVVKPTLYETSDVPCYVSCLVHARQQGNVSVRLNADSQMAIVPPLGKLAMLVRPDGCLCVCQTLGL